MKFWPFLFFFVFQISFGQTVSTLLVEKTPLKAEKYIGTDNFGNVYYIEENIFHKHGKEKNYQFTDLQLGELTSVDIINPLKITLFYKDANTVVFLDRHLIEVDRVLFNQLPNFRSVGFATTASNNSIWIFNMGSQELEVFDYLRKKIIADIQPIDFKVIEQRSNFNFCWLLTKEKLNVYNIYGSLIHSLPNPGFTKLVENNGRLIAKKENNLFFLGKKSAEFQLLTIPKTDVKAFYLNNENLYLYNGKFIYRYKLN